MSDVKTWLITISGTPYTDPNVAAGIDAALAAGAFGQKVSLLLQNHAVSALAAQQEPPEGARHLGKALASLPLYDIETVFTDRQTGFGHHDPTLPVQHLDATGIRTLIAAADHVLAF